MLLLLIVSDIPVAIALSQSNTHPENTIVVTTKHKQAACNCVIFRMDDIQDDYFDGAQLAVMNLFISHNQSLSLGLIMHYIGNNDSRILNKVSEGEKKGLFDLALHGWDHVDYTKLTETQQQNSLHKANEKMNHLFGSKSKIFITPYQLFNNYTLIAMKKIGLKVISSDVDNDNHSHFTLIGAKSHNSDRYGIYHLPSTIGFFDSVNGTWTKTPLEDIINATETDIAKYGFAVIMVHPQDIGISDKNGVHTDKIDKSQLNDLSYLLRWMSSKHIKLSTFSKVAGIK